MQDITDTLVRVAAWIRDASPWLQGLFGGAGATLLWEGVLKPARERRSLARVLGEEVALNLQLAAKQAAMFEHNPKSVPQDFHFLATVYQSVASRIGELPTRLVGDVVLLYAGLEAANRIPEQFADTFQTWSALGHDEKNDSMAAMHKQDLQKEMDLQISVFKGAVEKAVERANALLPQLRRAAVPRWRVDYFLRRKNMLSWDDVKKEVAAHAKKLRIGQGE